MRSSLLLFVCLASCEYAAGPYQSVDGDGGGIGVRDAGPSTIDLLVDTNRDGVLSAADDPGEDTWSSEHGAIFLANIDNDNAPADYYYPVAGEDLEPDGQNDVIDGEDDLLDLARIRIAPWPDAPSDVTAELTIDPQSASHVRIFRSFPDGWHVAQLPLGLGSSSLHDGIDLAIEGLELLLDPSWDGTVELGLTVYDAAGAQISSETAVLREAPMLLSWNGQPTNQIFVSDIGGADNQILIDAMNVATQDVGIFNYVINGLDPFYTSDGFVDQWAQDFFEVGGTWLPTASGWHEIKVGIRLKPPGSSGLFVEHELFGPDFGVAEHFGDLDRYDPYGVGASLDYGGNLEVVPPHPGYPVGRIMMGSVPDRHPNVTYTTFLGAQYAQAPILEADTSWLVVGHIDEYMSFVADPTSERGWKMLLTAPVEAWEMLQALVDDDPANADLVLYRGRYWANAVGGDGDPADITIGEVLADPDRAADQDVAQTHVDDLKALILAETDLTEDDFVYLPFLWETFQGSRYFLAYMPGMANLLTFEHVALVPKPFGPLVDGADPFEAVVRDRLEPLGLDVRFVDDWDLYHRLEGEIHCGTNVDRRQADGERWWEMDR